jgi:hypothetical protein
MNRHAVERRLARFSIAAALIRFGGEIVVSLAAFAVTLALCNPSKQAA